MIVVYVCLARWVAQLVERIRDSLDGRNVEGALQVTIMVMMMIEMIDDNDHDLGIGSEVTPRGV